MLTGASAVVDLLDQKAIAPELKGSLFLTARSDRGDASEADDSWATNEW
jgi:hypothetical protein